MVGKKEVVTMDTLQQLPVDKIKSSPSQARRNFDETSLAELAQAIQAEGLIQPITVRPLPDGACELIAGKRRLRAAKKLGWTTMEAKILEGIDDKEAATKGLG